MGKKKILYKQVRIDKNLALSPEALNAVEKLTDGQFSGLNLEKLHTKSRRNYYSIRASKSSRLILTTEHYDDMPCFVVLEETDHYKNSKYLRGVKGFDPENVGTEEIKDIAIKAGQNIEKIITDIPQIYYGDQYIIFDEEQQNVIKAQFPVIIAGPFGSGKTAISANIMNTPSNYKKMFITMSQEVVNNVRAACTETNQAENIQTYNDLLNDFLMAVTPENKNKYSFVGIKDFYSWAKIFIQTQKNLYKTPKKDTKAPDFFTECQNKPEELYEEFCIASGLSEEQYKALGKRQSLTSADSKEDKDWVWQAWQEYKNYLNEKNTIDPALYQVELPEDLPEAYQNIQLIVDETQLFTKAQLDFLTSLAQNNYAFFLDPHQSPNERLSKFAMIQLYYCRDIIFLHNTFRCSQEVTKLTNNIVNIKHGLMGGVATNDDMKQAPITDDMNKGQIYFIENEKEIEDYFGQELGTNFAVITNEELKEQAKKIFNTTLVLTPEEAQGLEYENVILYQPLDESFYEADKKLQSIDLTEINIHKSKKKELNHNTALNKVYIGATRAKENLYIVQKQNRKLANIINAMKIELEIPGAVARLETTENTVDDWLREARAQLNHENFKLASEIYEKHLAGIDDEKIKALGMALYQRQVTTCTTTTSTTANIKKEKRPKPKPLPTPIEMVEEPQILSYGKLKPPNVENIKIIAAFFMSSVKKDKVIEEFYFDKLYEHYDDFLWTIFVVYAKKYPLSLLKELPEFMAKMELDISDKQFNNFVCNAKAIFLVAIDADVDQVFPTLKYLTSKPFFDEKKIDEANLKNPRFLAFDFVLHILINWFVREAISFMNDNLKFFVFLSSNSEYTDQFKLINEKIMLELCDLKSFSVEEEKEKKQSLQKSINILQAVKIKLELSTFLMLFRKAGQYGLSEELPILAGLIKEYLKQAHRKSGCSHRDIFNALIGNWSIEDASFGDSYIKLFKEIVSIAFNATQDAATKKQLLEIKHAEIFFDAFDLRSKIENTSQNKKKKRRNKRKKKTKLELAERKFEEFKSDIANMMPWNKSVREDKNYKEIAYLYNMFTDESNLESKFEDIYKKIQNDTEGCFKRNFLWYLFFLFFSRTMKDGSNVLLDKIKKKYDCNRVKRHLAKSFFDKTDNLFFPLFLDKLREKKDNNFYLMILQGLVSEPFFPLAIFNEINEEWHKLPDIYAEHPPLACFEDFLVTMEEGNYYNAFFNLLDRLTEPQRLAFMNVNQDVLKVLCDSPNYFIELLLRSNVEKSSEFIDLFYDEINRLLLGKTMRVRSKLFWQSENIIKFLWDNLENKHSIRAKFFESYFTEAVKKYGDGDRSFDIVFFLEKMHIADRQFAKNLMDIFLQNYEGCYKAHIDVFTVVKLLGSFNDNADNEQKITTMVEDGFNNTLSVLSKKSDVTKGDYYASVIAITKICKINSPNYKKLCWGSMQQLFAIISKNENITQLFMLHIFEMSKNDERWLTKDFMLNFAVCDAVSNQLREIADNSKIMSTLPDWQQTLIKDTLCKETQVGVSLSNGLSQFFVSPTANEYELETAHEPEYVLSWVPVRQQSN